MVSLYIVRSNVDVIRAYQIRKAQDEWGMTTLPILKEGISMFQDQVFCTKDFYTHNTIVVFVHDTPDVVLGPNAAVSAKMDMSEAFLVIVLFTILRVAGSVQSILRVV
jgi:histone deacetylase 6